jgi:hypothetical protein
MPPRFSRSCGRAEAIAEAEQWQRSSGQQRIRFSRGHNGWLEIKKNEKSVQKSEKERYEERGKKEKELRMKKKKIVKCICNICMWLQNSYKDQMHT